jgi:hypothetical protein
MIRISAAHDGYRWLAGRPLHRRNWMLEKSRLTIDDAVEGICMPAVARFHLGPGVQASAAPGGRGGSLTTAEGRTLHWRTDAPANIVASQWHPEFGKTVATQALQVSLDHGRLMFELSW